MPEKYDSVIVEPDATWYTEDQKYGTSSKVGQPKSAPSPVKREDTPTGSKDKGCAVQILDSDDDDLGPSTSTKRRGGGAVIKGQVIDLTLSDDDDDEPVLPSLIEDTTPASATSSKRGREEDDEGDEDEDRSASRPRIDDYGLAGDTLW